MTQEVQRGQQAHRELVDPAATAEELKRCEAIIERGLQAAYEVGLALKEIHDRKLYKVRYKTFENYIRHRWGHNRNWGYGVMRAAEAANCIPRDTKQPNYKQAHALSYAPAEDRARIWESLQEEHGDAVTADKVRDAVHDARHENERSEAGEDIPPASPTATTPGPTTSSPQHLDTVVRHKDDAVDAVPIDIQPPDVEVDGGSLSDEEVRAILGEAADCARQCEELVLKLHHEWERRGGPRGFLEGVAKENSGEVWAGLQLAYGMLAFMDGLDPVLQPVCDGGKAVSA